MRKNIQTSTKKYIISSYRNAQINGELIKDNWEDEVTLDTKCLKDYFQDVYLGINNKLLNLKEFSYEEQNNRIIVNFVILQEEWTVKVSSKFKMFIRKI